MITTNINKAAKTLQENNIIAIPTETVYGLAGNAYSDEAIKKIYALKKRPLYNPLIIHIKSAEFLSKVTVDIPKVAFKLAEEFWPGPLTLVLKKQPHISDLVTSGKDTVAIRVPNHPLTLKLLNQLEFPVAAPSANPFGSISPTTAQHVHAYFKNQLDVILEGGACKKGIESTIIGFENEKPIVYRLGSLSIERIEKKIGAIGTKTHVDNNTPIAPGMLSRHYAPETETFLTDNIENFITENASKKIGALVFLSPVKQKVMHQEILSKTGNLDEAAQNLYAAMHRLDQLELDMIVAEKLPEIGLGKTINDKLQRATKKN